MALNCEEKLTAAIAKNCDEKPQGGLEVNAVLINYDDIDFGSSTEDGSNKLIITSLATNSGTQGFFLEGVKQTNAISCELVKKEASFDMYKHTFAGVILAPSAVNKELLAQIASGGRYVVVVEKKWKGTDDEDAFEILFWDSGGVISTLVYNSLEDDGVIKFELSSVEGLEEPEMTRNNLETDYDTTKTAFDAFYATA